MLRLKAPFELNPYESIYLDFIDSLLSAEGSKIYTHSLIVSEVVNAFLRGSFKSYKSDLPNDPKNKLTQEQINNLDFKADYRATDNYDFALQSFKDDFSAYQPYLHFLDGDFKVDANYLVNNIPPNSDFNDYFYYEMALDCNLCIVTNDRDFAYHGIDILTETTSFSKA